MTRPRWLAVVVVAALAVIFAFDLDHRIARLLAPMPPSALAVLRFITWFGQGGVVLWPSGLIVLAALLLRRFRPGLSVPLDLLIRRCTLLFTGVALAGIVNDIVKVIFGRARPHPWLGGDLSDFSFFRFGSDHASFPSGHTATTVAAAIILTTLFPRWRPGFVTIAILIAASRVLLDAHYLSDVIAGATVGAVLALTTLRWFERRNFLPAAQGRRSKAVL